MRRHRRPEGRGIAGLRAVGLAAALLGMAVLPAAAQEAEGRASAGAARATNPGAPLTAAYLDTLSVADRDRLIRLCALRTSGSTACWSREPPMTTGGWPRDAVMGALVGSVISGELRSASARHGSIARGPFEPDLGASRSFSGPTQYPPREFRGYGIVALEGLPVEESRGRIHMICEAFTQTFQTTAAIGLPTAQQFVTVWPVSSDGFATRLNRGLLGKAETLCDVAINNYGLAMADGAITLAREYGFVPRGPGPFLLAWLPSERLGEPDGFILSLSLSNVSTAEQAARIFREWKGRIMTDEAVLRDGLPMENVRLYIRDVFDSIGGLVVEFFPESLR